MMQMILEWAKAAITHYGYTGIFTLTFLDQIILPIPVDVFMPIASSVGLSFAKVMVLIVIACFAGAAVGYALGKYLGHPVAVWIFGQKNLAWGEKFIQKWGMWAVILAGVGPFSFKIVTWSAGIFRMPLKKLFLGMMLGLIPRYLIIAATTALVIKTKFYATTSMSAIILGVVQGLTEFLPISSSGHLVIMEQFLKLPLDVSLLESFDIILHLGSLLAILIYFRKDWWELFKDIGHALKTRRVPKESLLAKMALGTVPAILVGLFFANFIGGSLREMKAIAISFIAMAVVYLFVEWKKGHNHGETVTLRQAFLIGVAQAVALIPAVSRSGATIATGMWLGLTRKTAARFSFMLGGVGIFAANVYTFFSIRNGALMPNLQFTLIGFGTSFAVSLLAIYWLLRFLQNHTLRPFAFYSLLVGGLILSFF